MNKYFCENAIVTFEIIIIIMVSDPVIPVENSKQDSGLIEKSLSCEFGSQAVSKCSFAFLRNLEMTNNGLNLYENAFIKSDSFSTNTDQCMSIKFRSFSSDFQVSQDLLPVYHFRFRSKSG